MAQPPRHRLEGDAPRGGPAPGEPGLHLDTHSPLSEPTSIAVQQLVADRRSMVLDARVLVLDEPTSSLDRDEVDRLFTVIRDLRNQGVAILFVSRLPRAGLRDLGPDHGASQRQARRRVLRQGPPRGDLVTKMVGRAIIGLEANPRRSLSAASTARATPCCERPAWAGAASWSPPTSTSTTARSSGSRGSSAPDGPAGPAARTVRRGGSARSSLNGDPVRDRVAGGTRSGTASRSRRRDRHAEGIVAGLTVGENIALGIQARRGWHHSCDGRSSTPWSPSTSAPSAYARPTQTSSSATSRAATSRRCCSPLAGDRA